MALFRNGFKIFGEFSRKQGVGRIRSFSEDRKPGRWLPEDQWAVRQPGSTCPDPCKPPKKPPKPSKSWLSVCKDPEPPITCDIRHNNCPPPPPPKEGPWYSLDNLISKKKPEKPPPLHSCREEMKRREAEGEDEVCETMRKKQPLDIRPDNEGSCCMPKSEPSPAPVVTLSCPLPKEVDLMLWCGRPSLDKCRIAMKCQSDRLPYEEFRPQKCWKPSPFSLPCKAEPPPLPAFNRGSTAFAEFKQVELPRPLYTRYKSVELCDKDFMLCMVEVQCQNEEETHSVPSCSLSCCPPTKCPPAPCPSEIPPCRRPCLPPCCRIRSPPEPKPKKQVCPEKRVIEAASCKPVKIKKATKYTFRPKPTKLVEKRVLVNPLASCKCSNPESRPEDKTEESECYPKRCKEGEEPPKVITGTLTQEPQVYEREFCANNPPCWMYILCKPGCKQSPLVPNCDCTPREPDWSSETDGLKFYDKENKNIKPKPPPDPCEEEAKLNMKPVVCEAPVQQKQPAFTFKNRRVLMPEDYNIVYCREEDPCAVRNDCESTSFDEFIHSKTVTSKKYTKSYPPMKENILYDLQRLCPGAAMDPTKMNLPCLKPVEDPCKPRFFRCYSTFSPSALKKSIAVQLQRVQVRTECGDSSGKCKPRSLFPESRTCKPPKPKPACAEIALPCCPKARVPPSCNIRRPMPYCKKKLPPKPSFSECAKDPPPCPKITECNAWEKKMRENLNTNKRKYSDWTLMRKGFLKSLECQTREAYVNTVKCQTLKPKPNTSGALNNNVLLGLNNDPGCDYEPRSGALGKKTKTSPNTTRGNKLFFREDADVQPSGLMIGDVYFKNEEIMEAKENETRENLERVPSFIEEDKEISSDIMGSIGSWINVLFNAPSKRPATAPELRKPNREPELQNELDNEYLKSLNVFKERLKKKLKKQTTVHLTTGDNFLKINFEKLTDEKKKKKPNQESSSAYGHLFSSSKKNIQTISQDQNTINKFSKKFNDGENNCVPIRTHGSTELNKSVFVKDNSLKTERSKSEEPEEFFLATSQELPKNLLLNINEQEKFSQLYKNVAHLGIQEPQPYKQRRNSYQHNARCYTTNANWVETTKGNSLMNVKKNKRSVFYTEDTTDIADDNMNSKKNSMKLKRKALSELLGDDTFGKIKPPNVLSYSDLGKNESKTSSDDLVKHLIKKIKVTSTSQQFKKTPKKITGSNPKNRFMQSATTSLVVNVLAKKENDLILSLKSGSKLSAENKILKPDRAVKEWSAKHRDIRFEIKNVVTHRLNKSAYLNDVSDKPEPESGNSNFRPTWRLKEDLEEQKRAGKSKKFHDIKSIITKLNYRNEAMMAKQKMKKSERDTEQTDLQDGQSGRFQKEHEIFRNKSSQQTASLEANEENKIFDNPDSTYTFATPSEIIVLNTEIQSFSEKPVDESEKYEMAASNETHKTEEVKKLQPQLQSENNESIDASTSNELLQPAKPDTKVSNNKNKLIKTKSLQYYKEEDVKELLNPVTELLNEESQNQKQNLKAHGRQSSQADMRNKKTLEAVALNRSGNDAEKDQKFGKLVPFSQSKIALTCNDKKKDCENKDSKEKKKEKTDKNVINEVNENCGFEPSKKPGPNCDKSDFSP